MRDSSLSFWLREEIKLGKGSDTEWTSKIDGSCSGSLKYVGSILYRRANESVHEYFLKELSK